MWQKVQRTVCSSATDWLAVLTRWESYTHEWENTLESSTLKKIKERKYAKGAFTLNHSIALEVNQCSVHTVCSGYSRIILNKRTDVFLKASSIQLTETSGEKDLGRILSHSVLEKSLHSHMHTTNGLCFKYTIRCICHVSLSCHQGYNDEFRACSEYCVKMLSIFHTYCSHYRSLRVRLIFFAMLRDQPQTMLQALFLFSAIHDKSQRCDPAGTLYRPIPHCGFCYKPVGIQDKNAKYLFIYTVTLLYMVCILCI